MISNYVWLIVLFVAWVAMNPALAVVVWAVAVLTVAGSLYFGLHHARR